METYSPQLPTSLSHPIALVSGLLASPETMHWDNFQPWWGSGSRNPSGSFDSHTWQTIAKQCPSRSFSRLEMSASPCVLTMGRSPIFTKPWLKDCRRIDQHSGSPQPHALQDPLSEDSSPWLEWQLLSCMVFAWICEESWILGCLICRYITHKWGISMHFPCQVGSWCGWSGKDTILAPPPEKAHLAR